MVAMDARPRLYASLLSAHLSDYRQMAFVAGPRQVGKTTTCRELATVYLDWDNEDHREILLRGPRAVADHAKLDVISERPVVVVLDELRRYGRWKSFLKGFFDTHEDNARLLVTGSSRLDVYRRGGDSLMGRYFLYRMHPFSVAEIGRTEAPHEPIAPPTPIPDEDWQALWEHGGFPEPFLRRKPQFSRRWQALRQAQLLKEDVRDLTRIQQLGQLEMLARTLADRSGEQITYSSLARHVRISENTVRAWLTTLSSLHYGFLVRPWYKNVARSLRKEPKWFLRDWAEIEDPGKRFETLCACHLLKAVEGWTDIGFGQFELFYLRDKDQRESDFLVARDGTPWLIAEVKCSETALSPSLTYFQERTSCPHAFQLVMESPYVDEDCFSYERPVAAPARTFLSQLL